jgi:hypothetical protein
MSTELPEHKNPIIPSLEELQGRSKESKKTKKKPKINMSRMVTSTFLGLGGVAALFGIGTEVANDRAKEQLRAAGLPVESMSKETLELLMEKSLNGATVKELEDWASNCQNSEHAQERIITPDGNNEPADEVRVGREEMLIPPETNSSEINPFEQEVKDQIEVKEEAIPVPDPDSQKPLLTDDPFDYKNKEVSAADKIPLSKLADGVYSLISKDTVEITSLSFEYFFQNFVLMEETGADWDNDFSKLFVAVRDDAKNRFNIFACSRLNYFLALSGHFYAFPGDKIILANDLVELERVLGAGKYKVVTNYDGLIVEN